VISEKINMDNIKFSKRRDLKEVARLQIREKSIEKLFLSSPEEHIPETDISSEKVIRKIKEYPCGSELIDYLYAKANNFNSTYEYLAGAQSHVIKLKGKLEDKSGLELALCVGKSSDIDKGDFGHLDVQILNGNNLYAFNKDDNLCMFDNKNERMYSFSENLDILKKVIKIHEDIKIIFEYCNKDKK
jgi:hypothetical protein